jgi:hypothetical protein
MKISLALTAIILLLAAGLGWRNEHAFSAARTTRTKLAAQAANLGISVDPANPAAPASSTNFNRGQREDPKAKIKTYAADLIAFGKEMEASGKSAAAPEPTSKARLLELMDRAATFNAAELKALIAELRATPGLSEEERRGFIQFPLELLAASNPQAALAFIGDPTNSAEDRQANSRAAGIALKKLASQDPAQAAAWLLENSTKNPELATNDAKRQIIQGATAKDPALAFKLVAELGLKPDDESITSILRAIKTPADRDTTYAALKEYLKTIDDETARKKVFTYGVFVASANAIQEGFGPGSKWIADQKFGDAELSVLAAQSFIIAIKPAETGQWIDWIGENLPTEKFQSAIRHLVSQWTIADYKTAGEWLAASPAGPAKNVSVQAFAETVSSYEPEAAAQWAVTLPAGEARDTTLRTIYQNWPKTDPAATAAAEAFAQQHGLK